MLRHLVAAVAAAAIAGAPPARADEPAAPAPLLLPLPLFEVPRSLDLGYRFPTWEQATSLHHALIAGGHHAVHLAAWHFLGGSPFWAYFAEMGGTSLLDFGSVVLPFGQGWVHEEGHASAMAIVGLSTRQAFNPFSMCDEGSVCGLTDAQIASVHDRRAADWVRVQEAGMETELENAAWVERDVFFSDRPAYQHIPYLALQLVNVEAYRLICTAPGAITAADVLAESPEVTNRDFTGPDCTGWVFDLFRPATPYSDRGPHPLGGIRRIRLLEDLTPEESAYLGRMRNLGLLSFVDPFLFGFSGFQLPWPAGGPALRVNGAVRHHLTESGDLLELTLLGRREQWKLEATLRAYSNQSHTFPGLSLRLHRLPLPFAGAFASAAVWLWVQPRDHDFFAAEGDPGGALQLEGALPVFPHGEAFLRFKAKTAGWMAGDAALDAAIQGSVGINVVL
ncbi:MAG TPA: hypothetical protein VND93_18855 [Myxococcales bacterium]|nr:hypothetical protein [Myxococcales bacterium]